MITLKRVEFYRYAVAYVIHDEERRILLVKRPDRDEDLPGIWGLPAGSADGESEHHAVILSGREKLGVELKVGKSLGSDEIKTGDLTLRMEVFEAKIASGEPKVPQSKKGITQYIQLKWGDAQDLEEAARSGSLGSKIYLKSIGHILTT